MKLVRYFHIRHANASKGGATVRVEGDSAAGLEGEIRVSVAMCSPMDSFCRKTGRTVADLNDTNMEYSLMPLKGLPGKLHRVALSVLRRHKSIGYPRTSTDLALRDYKFSTKYWIPKPQDVIKVDGDNNGGGAIEGGTPKMFGASRHGLAGLIRQQQEAARQS